MLKISFWLKKSDNEQGNLEYITIDNPKKVVEGKLAGSYACEIYLPIPEWEKKQYLIYAENPIHALCLASEFVKSQYSFLLNRGSYTISEAESREPWKLEKKDSQVYLQEEINKIKNNQNIPPEERQKILGILKKTFGKEPSLIKDQINKAIDKKAEESNHSL